MINDNIQCMLFDLDGTLVDSMVYWRTLTLHQVKMRYAHLQGYNEKIETLISVLPYDEARRLISETFSIPLEEITTDREYTRGMMTLFYRDAVQPKEQACRLLREAHEGGVHTALLTATRRDLMQSTLDRLCLTSYLDLIYTPEEYPRGKWTADIFTDAMKYFGVKPEQTVLYEDSLYSMKIAKELGIRVVAVKDALNEIFMDEISSVADEVLDLGESRRELPRGMLEEYEKRFGRGCQI